MSAIDLVQFALARLTDFADFEALAREVLYLEGAHDLRPLGGGGDSGRDAVEEQYFYFEGKRTTTVYQISVQETLERKLADTITRLDEEKINFQRLVLVTSKDVTATRRDKLIAAGKARDVTVDVIDGKAIALKLADRSNGLLVRHFPDLLAQAKAFIEGQVAGSGPERDQVMRHAMVFTALEGGDRARESVLHSLVLTFVVASVPKAVTAAQVSQQYAELFPDAVALSVDYAQACLTRLESRGLVHRQGGAYGITDALAELTVGGLGVWEGKTRAISSDIADAVEATAGTQPEAVRARIERNAQMALGETFRVQGLELATQLLGRASARAEQLGSHERIIEIAKNGLLSDVAQCLVDELATLLTRPSHEQAEGLQAYSLGYLGASLIQIDPAVRELQATRFGNKTFVLDTDFLLDCVVTDLPRSPGALHLVSSLVELGAKIVVPDDCVEEALDHIARAGATVRYFGQGLLALTPEHVMERVNNAIAAGWYFHNQKQPCGFPAYLANYYEPQSPLSFLKAVIKERLPAEVAVGDLRRLLGVEPSVNAVNDLASSLVEMHKSSRKAQYRTGSETQRLAAVDANLYACVLATRGSTGTASGDALAARGYLLTSSLRLIRAAEAALGRTHDICARPDTLAGVLQLVGKNRASPKDFVALFDNPFLRFAVSQSWDSVEVLLDAGISVREKDLARLNWDLSHSLNGRIAEMVDSREAASIEGSNEAFDREDSAFVDLREAAAGAGYSSASVADNLAAEINRMRGEISELRAALDAKEREPQDTQPPFIARRANRRPRRGPR